jgi:hypothetical protein
LAKLAAGPLPAGEFTLRRLVGELAARCTERCTHWPAWRPAGNLTRRWASWMANP